VLIRFSYAQIIGQKCLPEWGKSSAGPEVNAVLGFATIPKESDGSVMDDEEHAVQALLMRDDITHDEAVQVLSDLTTLPRG